MIQPERVRPLNDRPVRPDQTYVLYWMQQSERTRSNPALEHAVALANELDRPLVACFGIMDDYPESNLRHYAFLVEGLRDVAAALEKRGVKFVVGHGPNHDVALGYARAACAIVCDRGYLRHQRDWRARVADAAECQVIEVEGDVVVPVDVVSNKHEYAARTIRPKIHKHLDAFLTPMHATKLKHPSLRLSVKGDPKRRELDVADVEGTLDSLKIDRSVWPSPLYRGGEVEAWKKVDVFVAKGLDGYKEGRNEPAAAQSSHQSMHLHYGHVSPVELALAVRDADAPKADRESSIEELIVRRELSMNFCERVADYDKYASAVPDWARKTLAERKRDKRDALYTIEELEHAKTDDPYWNAAQRQMTLTGFMHNYMRMYWGKRILGWMSDPEQAFEATLYLNNKYELDGRDANSFANIAWVYGTHDRPWGPARKVFGTVRYMNAGGLERKFDIDAYVRQVDDLAREHG
jgi:deoxyribodipyrimidine photo-lyase